MKSKYFLSSCACLIFFFIACNTNDSKKTAYDNNDTTSVINSNVDSVSIDSLTNTPLTPIQQNELNNILEREKEKEKMKKYYGPGYTAQNEIEILESTILYNSNFKPYAAIKIKNNLNIPFVAFEIIIIPKDKLTSKACKQIIIKKTLQIKANSTANLKEDIVGFDNDCDLDKASISLGDCIMSNGKKLPMGDLFRKFKAIGE